MAKGANCQVCGSGAHEPLVDQRGYRWAICRECTFAFLDPMPGGDELDDERMGRDYIASYERRWEKKMRRSVRRARRLRRLMDGRAVLDVGSNVGLFCRAARQVGLDPVGIEVNATLVEHARRQHPDIEFVHAPLEDAGFDDESFDGVYCSEVIEHVPDNNAFVAGLAAVMKPGAVLYLTTPGLHEYTRGGNPADWPDFGAPDHKLYYTRASLARMLEKHGLEPLRFSFNFRKGLKMFARKPAA